MGLGPSRPATLAIKSEPITCANVLPEGSHGSTSCSFLPAALQADDFEARDEGVEPTTFGSGGCIGGIPAVHSDSLSSDSIRLSDRSPVQASQPFSPLPKHFVPGVSPRLIALRGGAENLLSVRDVTEQLGVSTATVYGLVERGELPHVRVSNSIRIAPADLAAFISRRRTTGK
jgi:excisionase family DNA binding protein